MGNILVSVCMITYNHEAFIAEAIEGVLMQQTNFDIELIIADDNSPDNTEKIVNELIQQHPNSNIIKYTKHQVNKGMIPNFTWALEQCKGKYIALCEGDDYWTDPYKLQKQVDFLEANEEYAICFHEVKILKNNQLIDDYITREVNETSTIDDLAQGNFMHTNTVVFRKLEQNYPEWFFKLNAGDYALHLFNSQFGKIKKIKEPMSVYRIHETNVWVHQNATDMNAKILHDLNIIIEHLNTSVVPILINRFEKIGHSLIVNYLKNKKINEASEVLCKLISKKPEKYLEIYIEANKPVSIREHFKTGFHMLKKKIKKKIT